MQKLRILYFKKAVGITRSHLWNIDHSRSAMCSRLDGTPWVTLGEYDLITSYCVQYDSLFSYVSEHNAALASQREIGVYSRAMYLLPYQTQSAFEQQFWSNAKKLFLGVIRLHLVSCAHVHNKQITVTDSIQKLVDEKNLECCMYQTVELGDIVLALHSSSIYDILEFSESLNSIPDVAKTYTYCGMNLGFLKNRTANIPYRTIPFVSMSFSIRETGGIEAALQVLSGSMSDTDTSVQYAVTGTDDCVVTWHNVPESGLIKTFSEWVTQERNTNYIYYDLLNVHTTVGIVTNLKSWKIDSSCALTPAALCRKLSDSLLRFDCRGKVWYEYFNRLLSSLKYMANAPELDEFVFLFYPSANAILENLYTAKPDSKEDTKVFRYIENWNYLMENVMQSGGHLTLMPELHPKIFDIPPVFLEYTQAFLGECVTLLHDRALKDRVEFLLMPKMCEGIEAHELFNIFEYQSGLVLIDIPFSIFRDLKKMQIALCHEASHYVGDRYRKREIRYERFVEAAAVLIAKSLFSSFNPGLIDTLVKYFDEAIKQTLRFKHQTISRFRLKEIVSVIGRRIDSLFRDNYAYAQFLKDVYRNEQYTSSQPIKPIADNFHILLTIKYKTVPLLSDLYHLFRECFADLCAIYLLDLDPDAYYCTIECQFSALDKAKTERLAIRLAVALAASNRPLTDISPKKQQFFAAVEKHNKQCLNPPFSEPNDQVFPVASILNLYEYLSECFEALQSIDTGELSKFLVDGSDDAFEDWTSFYRLIDEYRSCLFATEFPADS